MSMITSPVLTASEPQPDSLQLIAFRSGGLPLAISAEHVCSLHEMRPEQISNDIDEFETPEAKLPVVALSELLSHQLGIELENSDNEHSLIEIRVDGEQVALRVGNVSTTITLKESMLHDLPRISHPSDEHGVLQAMAVIDENVDNPRDALRLIIDPARALGSATGQTHVQPPLSHEVERVPLARSGGKDRPGSKQILIFFPDSNCDQSPEYSFCLPLTAVAEVTSALPVLQLPMASPLLVGYVLWRKIPVPVINLDRCFGVAQSDGSHPIATGQSGQLVIARAPGDRFVGCFVDANLRSSKLPSMLSSIQLDGLDEGPLLGAFESEYGILVVPDLGTILDQSG